MDWRVCRTVMIIGSITAIWSPAIRAAGVADVAGGLPAEIARAQAAEAALQSAVADLTARVATLQTVNASLGARLAPLESTVASLSARLAPLESEVAAISAIIANLGTGISGYEVVFHEEVQEGAGTVDAKCPAGKKVFGGGGASDSPFFTLFASRPTNDDGWHVALAGPVSGTQHAARAWAICAAAP